MSDATIITLVTIICGCVVTIVQLLIKRDLIELGNKVDLQTKELAVMRQVQAEKFEVKKSADISKPPNSPTG